MAELTLSSTAPNSSVAPISSTAPSSSTQPATTNPPTQQTKAPAPVNSAPASIGAYRGVPITGGTQAQISAQIQAIDSQLGPIKTGSPAATDPNKVAQSTFTSLNKSVGADGTVDGSTARDAAANTATDTPPAPGSEEAIQSALDKLNADTKAYNMSTQGSLSMVDTYNNLLNEQGIPGLKTNLTNLQNIINGTVDDIRHEIQYAGGLVSESQVQSIADQRNKLLINQAQNLQNLIQDKEDYVDKVVTLTGEDRKAVSDRLNTQLDLDQKQLDMQITLQKTQATQTLAYAKYQTQLQTDAKARVNAMATTGALANASDARLQQLANDAGYDVQDLKDMRDAVARKDSLAAQKIQISINDKANIADAQANIAQGVLDGTVPPPMSRTGSMTAEGMKILGQAITLAKQQGKNLNIRDLELDWQADQKLTQTLNGQQFANFQVRSQTVLNTIDSMRSLSTALKRTGITQVNRGVLYGLSSVNDPTPVNYTDPATGKESTITKGQLAAKYISQASLLSDDLASVFSGSGSPTDKYLELAQTTLKSDWSDAQLQSALDTVYDNVGFRQTAIQSLKAGIGTDGSTDGSSPSAATLDSSSARSQYDY